MELLQGGTTIGFMVGDIGRMSEVGNLAWPIHVFGLWEKIGALRGRHMENVQTLHRQ